MSVANALAWKECREQRPVVLAALLVSAAMPFVLIAGTMATGSRLDLQGLAELMPAVLAGLVWPLFAAAAGGATIASELGEGTLGFLLSRPVPRARVWTIKIAVGAASMLTIFGGSLLVAWIFSFFVRADNETFSIWTILTNSDAAAAASLAAVSATALLYTSSVFFSTFLSRSMNAAAAGLASSLAMIALLFVIWSRLDVIPRLEPGLFFLEVLMAALAFLLGSRYLFCRGELLTSRGRSRRAMMVLGIAMLALALPTIPILSAQMRLSPATAMLGDLALDGSGDTIVAAAMTTQGMSPEVMVIRADGSGVDRPAGRLTFSPAISPDGKRIAYLSLRGLFGLRSNNAALKIMSTDGSEERTIATVPYESWSQENRIGLAFSPDGLRVALTNGSTLLLAPLNGEAVTQVELAGTPASGGRLAGWTDDGSEVVLLGSTWKPVRSSTLAAVGVGDGAIRVLHHEPADQVFLPIVWRQDRGQRKIPLLIRYLREGSTGFTLTLLNVDDGSTASVSQEVCGLAADISEDGSLLAYATCPPFDMTSTLHLLDISTGVDRVVGKVTGKAWSLLISPAKDRFLVHRGRPEGGASLPAVIVDANGSMHELEPGWAPMGWQGRERVVVIQDRPAGQLAVADAGTGAIRPFFPPPR